MQVRSLVYDEQFLKNADDSFFDELIHLKEPIPMNIKIILMDYVSNFNSKRSDAMDDDIEFRRKVREERVVSRELSPIEASEYHNNLALEFIDKHPEFAPIIKEVNILMFDFLENFINNQN